MTLDEQFQKLKALKINWIGNEDDFNNHFKKQEILADMPDLDKFKRTDLTELYERWNDDSSKDVFCLVPLLSKQQEFHLFRKMNFYKYKIKTILGKCKTPRKFIIDLINSLLKKKKEINDLIMLANTRLIMSVVKNNSNFKYGNNKDFLLMELFSDGVLGLIRALKNFDYTLGFRFSTFAVIVIKCEITKIRANIAKKNNHIIVGDPSSDSSEDNFFDEIADPRPSGEEEINNQDRISFLFSKMHVLSQKQQFIINKYFKENYTLKRISQEMNLSVERVRQLRDGATKRLKELLEGSSYKPIKKPVNFIKEITPKKARKLSMAKQYSVNPAKCLHCDKPINDYQKRSQKYCSRTCSVTATNLIKAIKNKTNKQKEKGLFCLSSSGNLLEIAS